MECAWEDFGIDVAKQAAGYRAISAGYRRIPVSAPPTAIKTSPAGWACERLQGFPNLAEEEYRDAARAADMQKLLRDRQGATVRPALLVASTSKPSSVRRTAPPGFVQARNVGPRDHTTRIASCGASIGASESNQEARSWTGHCLLAC